jgi:hypothetical protein
MIPNTIETRTPVPSDVVYVTKIVTTSQIDAEKAGRKWMKTNGKNCFARAPIVVSDTDNNGTWYTLIQWVAFY